MKKKINIDHTVTKDCRDKMLATVDVLTLFALWFQYIAVQIREAVHPEGLYESLLHLGNVEELPAANLESIRILGVCQKCNSIMSVRIDQMYPLLHIVLDYLLQNGRIVEGAVYVPSVDEIVAAVKENEIDLWFKVYCEHCDTDFGSTTFNGIHLQSWETPKLTI